MHPGVHALYHAQARGISKEVMGVKTRIIVGEAKRMVRAVGIAKYAQN